MRIDRLCMAMLLTAMTGLAQGVNFNAPRTYPVGAISLATADFNGDGKPDVVGAEGLSMVILLGNRDGTFQYKALPNLPSQASCLAVGDFNGDGKPDLVVTNAP